MPERENMPRATTVTLVFRLAHPTRRGANWRLQQVSEAVTATLPPGAVRLEMTWSRPGGIHGADVLSFDLDERRKEI